MIRLLLFLLLLAPFTLLADEMLYRLINQRLALMEQVAAYKWINQQPIAVPEREAFVISKAVEDGLQYGITTDSSGAFFRAQIEAAKDIQQCWFDRWTTGQAPETAEDLAGIIRPKLILLGSEITSRLAKKTVDGELLNKLFRQELSVGCLSEGAQRKVFDALKSVTTYPDRHTQVIESGRLRVGTTGDYAPFSYSGDDLSFTGVDIDLARNLAESLDVELVLVKTSWPTLMNDLAAGLFDIAMSGVSIIPARQQHAYFSAPYHVGGKSPITSCSRVHEFSSLEAIDQPGVRAIVNPGGTNERFIDANLTRTKKILHQDNRTIFDEIIKGNADLMITDSIEVRLQTKLHPELCASMPGETLTYQEKGYMMPKDTALRLEVNQWLEALSSQNILERTFEQHLN
ncbi:MAG: transporter substrate-binding domain-containing protein [Gammaproteobacteria bacterium]|nr:transporter substrate-binding domain-containing protein [Gammaproteobacteria bacterium]MBT6892421.1 transporter substrate-binding domain-containing protein [Gammaproteobacteria bacterium]MBT7878976.1 transporter substrate-binding domain-containing protein [Gammaproteobacteria bacterium]